MGVGGILEYIPRLCLKKIVFDGHWWHTPIIRALGRQSHAFKASLVYRASSTTARATQRNPVSKKQKPTKQTKSIVFEQ